MIKKIILLISFLYSFGFADVLNTNEAFKISNHITSDDVEIKFQLGKDIYVYKKTFNVKINETSILDILNMPKAVVKKDYEIFDKDFSIFIPTKLIQKYLTDNKNTLNLEYQGCAENGICYQPQFKKYHISENFGKIALQELKKDKEKEIILSEEQDIASKLSSNGLFLSLATFFGFGLLLSLTPCVFPMIPILSSIIVSKSETSKNSFLISAVYVFAMSLAYAIAGVLASIVGVGVQGLLQNSWVLGGFSLIFVALAFSMFGFYDIKLPSKLENLINKKTSNKKGMIGVFIMGFASALIVSPCIAAPLAGALLYISQTGNLFYGGLMLFVMGIGMGVPLLIIGLSSGKILPKPGIWMDTIKYTFGFLMLIMAIWLLSRILGSFFELLGYGVIGVIWAVYIGAFESAKNGIEKFQKSSAILIFIYSLMLIFGSFIGSKDPLSPLEGLHISSNTQSDNQTKFEKVKTLNDLNKIIQTSDKPILVDFWASWCVSCLELDSKTFKDKDVMQKLKEFKLVKIDVSENKDENTKLLQNFGLINPPALLLFKDKQEISHKRTIGYISPEKFLEKIKDIK
ncbi:protein-disulfide reductase DsbD [Campylobacter pinnipediorum]|uniref:protein-disulfide reductase DsbD n=1 Tax=Campylobacter pinnipediorum TaxID=1965231 RepID=UPI00084D52DB|nr:protein-disulfide reductase DsbD [Campylobacter pinnipediorum]AQW80428.1 thiol:disulfide interchange protein DsbD [Campylobacter pinnipediorum subsp. pinnipediorum]AQW82098.1 thiol:disulfide interchange protein DsbD [Campylobacter pinnipediorum subsp. pinnipediorum]